MATPSIDAILTLLNSNKLQSAPLDGLKATYSTSYAGLVPVTSPTDIMVLGGSSTKTIRLLSLEVTATKTTSGPVVILLYKHTAANTGGSPVNTEITSHDSTNDAVSASAFAYSSTFGSSNPTINGAGTVFRSLTMIVNPQTTTDTFSRILWEFGSNPGQAIILRGTAQQVAINLEGTTITGGSFDINMTWTEEE